MEDKKDYEIFINRLHKTYQNNVTVEEFEKLTKLKKQYNFLCLNIGYGNYMFEVEKNKDYINWYLGKIEKLNFEEAKKTCEKSYFNISQIESNKEVVKSKPILTKR